MMHKITSLHFMRPFSRSAKRTSSLCSRLIETFIYILLLSLPLVSCSADEPESETPVVPDNGEEGIPSSDNVEMITYTHAVPDGYDQEAEERGSVVRIDYDTRDYAEGSGATRTNTAYVYLPYGYDGSRRYNILYFVHGHYSTAASTFEDGNGVVRKLLDQMIAHGDIDPMIVVTPSYNYGQPTASYADADPYCRALPQELVNDLIPVVEGRYRTYAETTDAEGIEASRDHRAIGGFSMGAVTTWYAFDETLDAFRWFMPVSGDCWSLGRFAGMNRPDDTAAYLAEKVQQSPYTGTGFYIWAASGTNDSAYSEILLQIEGMARLGDVFNTTNMTFHQKEGARHEFRPIPEYLYNALPFFFPKNNE